VRRNLLECCFEVGKALHEGGKFGVLAVVEV
jgi:hypothetical protein